MLCIKQHGANAAYYAAGRADELLEQGAVTGAHLFLCLDRAHGADASITEMTFARPSNGSIPWDELFPAEQARIVHLLVERVDVGLDSVDIRLRTEGLASVVADLRASNTDMRRAA